MNLKKYGKNRILAGVLIGGMFLLFHPMCSNNYKNSDIYKAPEKKITQSIDIGRPSIED
jgi:hypothetical protein